MCYGLSYACQSVLHTVYAAEIVIPDGNVLFAFGQSRISGQEIL